MNTKLIDEINQLVKKNITQFESTKDYSYVKYVLEPFNEILELLTSESIAKEKIINNTYGIGYMVLDNYNFSRSKSGKEILKLCKKIRKHLDLLN